MMNTMTEDAEKNHMGPRKSLTTEGSTNTMSSNGFEWLLSCTRLNVAIKHVSQLKVSNKASRRECSRPTFKHSV